MFDVITFGSATVDIFVNTEDKLFIPGRKGCSKIPFGSKIAVKDLHILTGGGGTNTAACLSTLGLKTAYCGKIGDDTYGKNILKDLKRFKVSTKLIKQEKGFSGLSIILDSKGHDRTILTHKGVADELEPSEVTKTILNKGKYFYVCSLMGVSFGITKKIVDFCQNKNKIVAFNPSEYLIKTHRQHIRAMLPKIHYLICNKEEAQLLVGKKLPIRKLLKSLHTGGSLCVVITDGNKGVYAYNGTYYTEKAHKIRVVETIGAGDAFGAAFFAAIIKGKEIKEALAIGVLQAEQVISHFGAKERLLSMRKLTK